MADLSRMLTMGFVVAGSCVLDRGLKSGVRFSVIALKAARAIYAFCVDKEIKYVGVCDSSGTCLSDRMARYQGLIGAGTNRRIAALLRSALEAGAKVEILAWVPQDPLEVAGLRVDLVKGLENPLIASIEPEWNIHS